MVADVISSLQDFEVVATAITISVVARTTTSVSQVANKSGYGTVMRPMLAVAAGAALLLAAPAAAPAQTPADTTPTVAADGAGTATLTPDIADFGVAVRETARSSASARGAANRVVAA